MAMIDWKDFLIDRIGQPHQHHRHCIHNLSREEQLNLRRKNHADDSEWTDEEMAMLGLDRNIVVITPDDWEIDVPDVDWSSLEVTDGND